MTEVAPSPSPSWYMDPSGDPSVMRWWDGQQWAPHTIPAPGYSAPTQFAPVPRKPVNHLLHLILSLLTFGLWIPVWIIVAVTS